MGKGKNKTSKNKISTIILGIYKFDKDSKLGYNDIPSLDSLGNEGLMQLI